MRTPSASPIEATRRLAQQCRLRRPRDRQAGLRRVAKSNPNGWGHAVERVEFDDKVLSVPHASSASWMLGTASGEWDAVTKANGRCNPMRNREGSRWLLCDHVGATGCRWWHRRRCLNPLAGPSPTRLKGVRHYSRTISVQARDGSDCSALSRTAEEISLMGWFLILTVRVPLTIYLVAKMQ